jgi:dihydrofolate reductase
MGKVILGLTMSLDGYINDRNGSVGRLYPDFAEYRDSELLQESIRSTGAVVMGRHAYDMANGDFTDYEFQVPIFVITHEAPQRVAKGENDALSFIFVTNGVKTAIERARAAARDKDVTPVGGANAAQQCLAEGLVDELQVDVMSVLLGGGLRLFEHLGDAQIELEKLKVIEIPTRTHLRFRVVK